MRFADIGLFLAACFATGAGLGWLLMRWLMRSVTAPSGRAAVPHPFELKGLGMTGIEQRRDLRAELMRQHAAHERQAEKYTERVMALPNDADTSEAELLRAAWLGHSMAASYSYALAAIEELVARTAGEDLAGQIALQTAMIIADGDSSDLNRDFGGA